MHALREIAIRIEGRYCWSLSRECIEQRLGLLQVDGVKSLGEPVVHLHQQRVGLSALALELPQATQAHGGAQFEGFCLLVTGHIEGVLKTRLGFVVIQTALSWVVLSCAQE